MGATAVRPVFVPDLGVDARSSARLRARIAGTVVHLPGMGRRETVPALPVPADRLVAALGEGPASCVRDAGRRSLLRCRRVVVSAAL
jgi:hypothetical protein